MPVPVITFVFVLSNEESDKNNTEEDPTEIVDAVPEPKLQFAMLCVPVPPAVIHIVLKAKVLILLYCIAIDDVLLNVIEESNSHHHKFICPEPESVFAVVDNPRFPNKQ